MFWLGGEIPDDFHVHHIDGNKLNATRENLVLVPSRIHLSYHNAEKNAIRGAQKEDRREKQEKAWHKV